LLPYAVYDEFVIFNKPSGLLIHPQNRNKLIELVNSGKHVFLFGLDGDSNRQLFGNTIKLIPHCDSIVKLNGTCRVCGMEKGSIFSVCKNDDQQATEQHQINVGGESKYMAVCRKCR
jgi:thymidine kinase